MRIERKKIKELNRATYNPRIDLKPGDTEYENLKNSINKYGYIVPIIWNERTNNIVGGHQRLSVLENSGETEVGVSVVNLDEIQEKQLNIALNKVEGKWDIEKLTVLLNELGDDAILTGYTQQEIDNLENDIDSLIDFETVDNELKEVEELFNITLRFSTADKEDLMEYIKENGKESLVRVIIQKVKEKL